MTNKITAALEDGAQKLGKALGEDAGKTIKALYHDTHARLKKVSHNYLEADAKHAAEIQKIAKGETPVYHMTDDGSIRRLHPDGSHSVLAAEDKDRLGLDEANIGRPKRGEQNARLKTDKEGKELPRPQVSSQQVTAGSTDLSVATQLARHADQSYGGLDRKGEFQSNNYAAARVAGANGKNDFILVARSNGYRHSERMIGTPFLRQGDEGRITHLYTERAPCDTGVNCSAWMAERLPDTAVTHSFGSGNDETKFYLPELQANR
ncbi:nucleic acid/nucleotide deaminase domain-containing protein [Streptomyces sp. NPDC003480]